MSSRRWAAALLRAPRAAKRFFADTASSCNSREHSTRREDNWMQPSDESNRSFRQPPPSPDPRNLARVSSLRRAPMSIKRVAADTFRTSRAARSVSADTATSLKVENEPIRRSLSATHSSDSLKSSLRHAPSSFFDRISLASAFSSRRAPRSIRRWAASHCRLSAASNICGDSAALFNSGDKSKRRSESSTDSFEESSVSFCQPPSPLGPMNLAIVSSSRRAPRSNNRFATWKF